MLLKHKQLGMAVLIALLIVSGAGTAQAVNTVFMSGDQGSYNTGGTSCSGADPECVAVNTKTSYQDTAAVYSRPPGESAVLNATGSGTDRDVLTLNGSGGAGSFTFPNTFWNQPGTANAIITGNVSLNQFLTTAAGSAQTAAWVSYTNSGTTGTGANISPNPPAVPNYCGTTGAGSAGAPTVGGNNNPTGTPGCTSGSVDPKGNQNIPANDPNRTKGNQTAKFTQTVNVTAGLSDLEFYVWTDDTSIVDVLKGGVSLGAALTPSVPFPAPQGTSGTCIGTAVSCGPGQGQKFTASGLSAGTYTFEFYSFQIGSDVFGNLWGGAFFDVTPPPPPPPDIPEPATVLLLGAGLAGLGLMRRMRKAA